MRYKVKEADAESQISKRLETIDKTWERPVRCSTVLILSLGFGLVGLSVYTAFLLLSEYQGPKACISEECVQTAARILKAMDTAVAPCDDFYEFACGGWMRLNQVPEWSTNWDQLARLREQLVTDLRELLREPDDPDIELPDSVNKAKAMYRTCMDTDKLESAGVEPIQQAFRKLGLPPGAPHEGGADPRPWHEVAGRARRMLGLSVLLAVQVTEDVRNTSRNRIVIEQVTPGFSERYLLQSDRFAHEVEQYKKYISSMVQKMDPEANSDEFADDIINFSKSLASIMTPAEVRRSGTHLFHEVSVTQLVQGTSGGPDTWKKHDWKAYLDLVFENTNVTLHPDKDRVIVMDLPYLQKLSVLLSNSTPIVVEKFLWWSVFSTVAPMTLSAFRDMGFTFSKEVFGLQQRTPRWKGCTANANANFGLALSYLYVRRHFDQESRQKAIEMLEDVREAFAAAVKDLDWMDNTTRLKTLNKLRAIRNYVGFPAWLLTSKQLDTHYKGVVRFRNGCIFSIAQHEPEKEEGAKSFIDKIFKQLLDERKATNIDESVRMNQAESVFPSIAEVVEGNLFETYLTLTQAAVKKNLESLREKPDRNRWVATPTTINAFYSATLNSVTFPAGILQPPFYGNGLEAINYGSIGAIMGHEVTHGFDDQGRRYDENGNLKQWWSAATLEHYHTKVQCIIDQYNTYHMAQLPNYTVHGFNTQGENIADNGGLRAALNAYSLYSSRNRQVQRDRLPGLPQYKPEQLFFLGFAQIWCGNQTVGALKSKLVEGVHSPNRIRVIGTLSNSKEFAEAWNCPADSPMNPIHKCVLW